MTISRRTFLGSSVALVPVLSRFQDETLDATEDNIEGPYYLPNAPWRTKLHEDQGTILVLTGVVKARNGRPLPGAVLDFWQADAEGRYYNDENDDPRDFRFRGRVKADEKGAYAIETIRPGRYKLSATRYRPAHIHLKASAEGYKPLTTQIYFHDDEFNRTDPWFKRSLAVEPKEDGKKLRVEFRVVLAKA